MADSVGSKFSSEVLCPPDHFLPSEISVRIIAARKCLIQRGEYRPEEEDCKHPQLSLRWLAFYIALLPSVGNCRTAQFL